MEGFEKLEISDVCVRRREVSVGNRCQIEIGKGSCNVGDIVGVTDGE